MSINLVKIKIGNYEFEINAESVSVKNKLLQDVKKSLNGHTQVSYIPKDSSNKDIIKRTKIFNISGTDLDNDQIEAIENELCKKPPIYFRNSDNKEYQVCVSDDISNSMQSDQWTNRPYSFSLEEY